MVLIRYTWWRKTTQTLFKYSYLGTHVSEISFFSISRLPNNSVCADWNYLMLSFGSESKNQIGWILDFLRDQIGKIFLKIGPTKDFQYLKYDQGEQRRLLLAHRLQKGQKIWIFYKWMSNGSSWDSKYWCFHMLLTV